ncbi:MAG: choice-of-anchor B family protein [Gemmatimonadota bacterium]|nr:choice-of-anchor B family protein [Gemmatimonadota bacterium]
MQNRPLTTAALLLAACTTCLMSPPAAAQEPNFGRAMAMTDSDLFVGQPVNWYGPGMVYAYRADGDGEWREHATLAAPDSSRMDDFGRALAVDGNTLVVAAPRKRDGSGVVYAFERASSEGPWREAGVIEPPRDADHTEYGVALAFAGDDLLVGAPAAEGTGVVYHFRRTAGEWELEGVLRPASGGDGTGFGRTLRWEGDRLLIGAPAADSARGRVYAAARTAGGGWSTPRTVELPSGSIGPDAAAGAALEMSGDRAYVGAPGAATVFVLERDDADGWRATGTLRPYHDPSGTQFGYSVARVEDEVWVGAPGVDGSNGRVYRFTSDGADGWSAVARLDPDDTSGTSWPLTFGYSLAAAQDRAVVGMPMRDFGEGRAMALRRAGDGWRSEQILEGRIFRIGETLSAGDRCEEGMLGEFSCENMELVAHMPIGDLGGERGVWVNDVWGWTDPSTDRDYALVARRDGASFIDVTEPSAPRLMGTLSRTDGSRPSVWRDIKVIGNHAYIVSDGAGAHGMQVFDLTRLRDVGAEPVDFEPDTTYHEIHSAHNVVADTASQFLYIVGANGGGQTCGGGLHMVDARDPERPTFAGCYHDDESQNSRGYTHDAQCLVYEGPDERYRGREICVGSNESEINIADVTDKTAPETIARMSYPSAAYTHQGWFDDEQRYFYMNDELDELAGNVEGTRTIVWDLTELDDPIVANEYIGPVRASDHNLYVQGDRMYQSNYGSGLRVLDISDRTDPREIAFFDSAPYNEDEPGHSATQSGAWSNYPFFESGLVIFTSVREGLFIMRVSPPPVS